VKYMDLWGYDYDRTEALVGDPCAGDWPDHFRLDRPRTIVAPDPGAARTDCPPLPSSSPPGRGGPVPPLTMTRDGMQAARES
jgi:hypothetical protein